VREGGETRNSKIHSAREKVGSFESVKMFDCYNVCCRVLQRVIASCSELQCDTDGIIESVKMFDCCSVLQHVTASCSALQLRAVNP